MRLGYRGNKEIGAIGLDGTRRNESELQLSLVLGTWQGIEFFGQGPKFDQLSGLSPRGTTPLN